MIPIGISPPPRTDGVRRAAPRTTLGEDHDIDAHLAILLERFFTQRLMQQRQRGAHTISSYRDTFRLLLVFTQQRLRKPPSRLALTDIDAPLIVAFLAEMEQSRGIAPRSRNLA